MRVEIWSDVVCPWCYIGKRRFETAVERVQGLPGADKIEIVYRPYQLDPSAAPGQMANLFVGIAFAEALGIFSFLIALLLMFAV